MPQACNDPAAGSGLTGTPFLKRDDEGPPNRGAGGITHDSVNRDVFPVLALLTDIGHRERLDDAFRAWIESDGGVLLDDCAVEGSRRLEELQQGLLLGGGGARD